MVNVYIQNTINELKILEKDKEELEKKIKNKEAVLKNYMVLHNVETLHGNYGETVQYYEVIANRFDTKNFKKYYEQLYHQFLKKSTSLRFKFSY